MIGILEFKYLKYFPLAGSWNCVAEPLPGYISERVERDLPQSSSSSSDFSTLCNISHAVDEADTCCRMLVALRALITTFRLASIQTKVESKHHNITEMSAILQKVIIDIHARLLYEKQSKCGKNENTSIQ